jgi:hypothetical protein
MWFHALIGCACIAATFGVPVMLVVMMAELQDISEQPPRPKKPRRGRLVPVPA